MRVGGEVSKAVNHDGVPAGKDAEEDEMKTGGGGRRRWISDTLIR